MGFAILASIFLLGATFQDLSIPDNQVKSSQPKLVAKLTEDKINIERRLRLTITFVNDGSEPITIYQKLDIGLWTGLIPVISDEKGKVFPNTIYGEPLFKGNSSEKIPVSDFVTIGPKESFVFKKTIYLDTYLIESPGRYSLILYYENPLPHKVIPPGITVWNPPPDTIKTEPLYFVFAR